MQSRFRISTSVKPIVLDLILGAGGMSSSFQMARL